MDGMSFTWRCGSCGGKCTPIANSGDNRWRVSAVVECDQCSAEWMLTVTAILAEPAPIIHKRFAVCGTISGFRKHYRDGSEPCDACKAAKAGKKPVRQVSG